MKAPDQDPLDTLLDQSLQSASHCLHSENFRIQFAGRFAAEQRRMKRLRLLPAEMGLLAAVIVYLVGNPKSDFRSVSSSFLSLLDKATATLMWLMHSLLPGTPHFISHWVVLVGVVFMLSFWATNREPTVFRL
ncbi:MAG: hypothetical protein WCH57_01270 [Verrucomicrobiota bacterium]